MHVLVRLPGIQPYNGSSTLTHMLPHWILDGPDRGVVIKLRSGSSFQLVHRRIDRNQRSKKNKTIADDQLS